MLIADITMSLDGYVAAPGVDLENGLGVDGMVLHDWVFDRKTAADQAVLHETLARTGAVIIGRTMFDIVDGPNGWNDELGYGAEGDQSNSPPVIVVTSRVPDRVRLVDRFEFVTGGLADAAARAFELAGEKDVYVAGGGQTVRGFLSAGLADRLRIHLAPIILGGGTPLFEPDGLRIHLEQIDRVSTPAAEHLTYRVLKPGS